MKEGEIMTKVFYSVDYKIQGSDKTHRMWFDKLKEAKEFSKADYRRSNPVTHEYSSAEIISLVEQLIELQKN